MSFRTFHITLHKKGSFVPMSYWTGKEWWDERKYAFSYDNEKEAEKLASELQPTVGPDLTVKVSRFTY